MDPTTAFLVMLWQSWAQWNIRIRAYAMIINSLGSNPIDPDTQLANDHDDVNTATGALIGPNASDLVTQLANFATALDGLIGTIEIRVDRLDEAVNNLQNQVKRF